MQYKIRKYYGTFFLLFLNVMLVSCGGGPGNNIPILKEFETDINKMTLAIEKVQQELAQYEREIKKQEELQKELDRKNEEAYREIQQIKARRSEAVNEIHNYSPYHELTTASCYRCTRVFNTTYEKCRELFLKGGYVSNSLSYSGGGGGPVNFRECMYCTEKLRLEKEEEKIQDNKKNIVTIKTGLNPLKKKYAELENNLQEKKEYLATLHHNNAKKVEDIRKQTAEKEKLQEEIRKKDEEMRRKGAADQKRIEEAEKQVREAQEEARKKDQEMKTKEEEMKKKESADQKRVEEAEKQARETKEEARKKEQEMKAKEEEMNKKERENKLTIARDLFKNNVTASIIMQVTGLAEADWKN